MRAVHVGRLGEGRHAVLLVRHAELEEAALLRHAVGMAASMAVHVPLRLRCAGRARAITMLVLLLLRNLGAEGVVQVLDVELVGQLLQLVPAMGDGGAVSEVGEVEIEVEQIAEVLVGAGHVELFGARPCWRRTRGAVHLCDRAMVEAHVGDPRGYFLRAEVRVGRLVLAESKVDPSRKVPN